MKDMKRYLSRLPAWFFSCLTFLAIIWLTLAPKPLGEKPPPLFPGADKLAHGIMFGGLTAMMLLDWQRKHEWKDIGPGRDILYAVGVSMFGVLIEIMQAVMDLGRGFEYSDIVADTIGSFFFASIFLFSQKFWQSTLNK